jgi:hypothetical protein
MDDCAIAFSQKRLLWWQQRSDLDPLHLSGTLVYRWQPQMRLDLLELAIDEPNLHEFRCADRHRVINAAIRATDSSGAMT